MDIKYLVVYVNYVSCIFCIGFDIFWKMCLLVMGVQIFLSYQNIVMRYIIKCE